MQRRISARRYSRKRSSRVPQASGVQYLGFVLATLLCLAEVICLTGCGHRPKPLPPTYPVHGKVNFKDGRPATGGLVQFQSQAEPSVTTTATIGCDGTYRLVTMRDGQRVEGAVTGLNRVTILVTSGNGGDRNGLLIPGGVPTIYPTPLNVEPHDNEFNLTLPQPSAPSTKR